MFASALAYHRNSKFGCRNEKKVSERASKQANKQPPRSPSKEMYLRAENERQTYQKQAVCSLSEIDGFKQLVKKRNSPLSVSVCGALEKAQAQTQALSLTPISTMEKTASPVVVVVVHAHTLSSKQDCVELRKLAAPFIHSLLDFLGALLLSNSPQNVRPKVRGDDEEKRRRRRRKSHTHTHTHTHKHTQGTRGGDNGSTDNQTRGNQSD